MTKIPVNSRHVQEVIKSINKFNQQKNFLFTFNSLS